MFKATTNISKSKLKQCTNLSSNVENAGEVLKHLVFVPAYREAGLTVLFSPTN